MGVEVLKAGDSRTVTETVRPEHFASKIMAAAPDVFSTPWLGALAEAAAAEILQEVVDEGQMTVGTELLINHTAPTPEGLEIHVTATVNQVDGRRVNFDWSARDSAGEIGHGTHQRFVVDTERFMAGVDAKRK